jgi:flagellar biosynthetic protein FliR
VPELALGGPVLAAYALALARTAGFVLVAPPFNTKGVPAQARVGVALALAVPLSTWTASGAPALGSSSLVTGMVLQVVTGAVLGYLVLVAVAVVQTVGDLVDVAGGFSISIGMDPLLMVQSSVMGRLHQLTAITLLFVGNGHLMVLRGLSHSLELMPEGALNWQDVAATITSAVSGMFLAAVQVTAPILAALLIADVALGLLTRAAPALNAFALAFPLKIALSLLLIGLVIAQLPGVLGRMVEGAVLDVIRLSGG